MKGLSKETAQVFESLKDIEIFNDYMLIGGSALAMQIGHRLSEDLDFCKWQDDPGLKNDEVNWPEIEAALSKLGSVDTDVLDLHQVSFVLDEVKLSFYSNALADSRDIESEISFNRIHLANLKSLGAMKLEVMSRRNIFRDYYDVFSILQEGISIKEIVTLCGRYSRHRMKSKMILSLISDGSLFRYEEEFELLHPKFRVNSGDIEVFIRQQIAKEFG